MRLARFSLRREVGRISFSNFINLTARASSGRLVALELGLNQENLSQTPGSLRSSLQNGSRRLSPAATSSYIAIVVVSP